MTCQNMGLVVCGLLIGREKATRLEMILSTTACCQS
jgi:hypothetical protein